MQVVILCFMDKTKEEELVKDIKLRFEQLDEQLSSNRLTRVCAEEILLIKDGLDSELGVEFTPLELEVDEDSSLTYEVIRMLSASGVGDGGVRVRGVGPGAQDTDAVNVEQLNTAISDVKSYIDETILGGAW